MGGLNWMQKMTAASAEDAQHHVNAMPRAGTLQAARSWPAPGAAVLRQNAATLDAAIEHLKNV